MKTLKSVAGQLRFAMTNNGNSDGEGSDRSTLGFSRRNILAATGLAGLGLVGSASASAQDPGNGNGPSNAPFAVKEHDHSGTYGAAAALGVEEPVTSITVDELTSAHHNATVYASEFNTLNEAVDSARERTDGDIKVVLPPGSTQYTDTINVRGRSITIQGQGKNQSKLEADGVERMITAFFDEGDPHSVSLEGFTLDLMQEPGKGRAFTMENGHTMAVRDVRIREMNLANRDGQYGLIRGVNVELLDVVDNEIRFDTMTNRAGAGSRDKIRVVNSPVSVKQFNAVGNRLIGERLPIDERPERNFLNGFRVEVAENGIATVRDNIFENWDQYATFIGGKAGASVFVVNNALPNAGDADIIRAHAAEDGAQVVIHGNTIEKGDELTGDRGIISQSFSGAVADSVRITDNYIEGVMVPIEVNNGARNMIVTGNTIKNCGHLRLTHDAILLRSAVGGSDQELMRNARVAGNVIDNTEVDRKLGNIIRFAGETWEGFAVVENNIADGIVAESIDEAIATNLGDSDVEIVVRDNLLTTAEYEYDPDIPDYEIRGTIPRQELTIDGDPSEVTDTAPHVSLNDGINKVSQENDTLHRTDFWFRYDESAIYVVGIVEDDAHYQPNSPGSLFNADGVQFGVAQGPPGATPDWDEINMALTQNGPKVYRRTYPQGPEEELTEGVDLEIVRNEEANETIYEARIEWDVVQADFQDAGIYSLDLAGVDHDGAESREGLWQWGGENVGDNNAMFGGKETTSMKPLEFV